MLERQYIMRGEHELKVKFEKERLVYNQNLRERNTILKQDFVKQLTKISKELISQLMDLPFEQQDDQ
jgi:hypothetical protein